MSSFKLFLKLIGIVHGDCMNKDSFGCVENYSVIIPYKDLEMMVEMSKELEEIKKQYARLQDQYAAIRLMFSECLQKIKEIYDFVGNS